jgi:hypothetical protein
MRLKAFVQLRRLSRSAMPRFVPPPTEPAGIMQFLGNIGVSDIALDGPLRACQRELAEVQRALGSVPCYLRPGLRDVNRIPRHHSPRSSHVMTPSNNSENTAET